MFDHARDRTLPSQTGRGHLEVSLDRKNGVHLHAVLPTSMRLDYLHRSTMTNTLAWNLTLLEQPQHDNPKLTLPGD